MCSRIFDAPKIIGANTVVVKDISPHFVLVGNPGRVVKFINE